MKTKSTVTIAILCLTLCIQCKDSTRGFDTWFWTSNKDQPVHLFVDDEDKGPLPQLDTAPRCDDEGSKRQALFVHLSSGNHDVEIKNSNGNVKYSEVLKLKLSNGSKTIGSTTDWKESGSRGTNVGDCLIREIWY